MFGFVNRKNDFAISSLFYMILMIKMIDTEKASLVPVGRREFKPVEIANSSNIKELATIEAGRSHPSGCD